MGTPAPGSGEGGVPSLVGESPIQSLAGSQLYATRRYTHQRPGPRRSVGDYFLLMVSLGRDPFRVRGLFFGGHA